MGPSSYAQLAGDGIALPVASPAPTTSLGHDLAASAAGGRGGVVIVEDFVEASGAFFLHHLLKLSTLFVPLAYPFTRYDRIMKKLLQLMVLSVFNGYRVRIGRFFWSRDATWRCRGIKIGSFSSTCPKWRPQLRTGNV